MAQLKLTLKNLSSGKWGFSADKRGDLGGPFLRLPQWGDRSSKSHLQTVQGVDAVARPAGGTDIQGG